MGGDVSDLGFGFALDDCGAAAGGGGGGNGGCGRGRVAVSGVCEVDSSSDCSSRQ